MTLRPELLGPVAAVCAAVGVHLLVSLPTNRKLSPRLPELAQVWLRQAGVQDVGLGQFIAVEFVVLFVATFAIWAIFGAVIPALFGGIAALTAPLAVYRGRRSRLAEEASDAWPAMLEELRLRVGALGRSVPAALLEVGQSSDIAPMRSAFEAAQREWLLSTDFRNVVAILSERLSDPTADVVLQTLLVANEVGGTDLDRRLARLCVDRQTDLRNRREAASRQAGVRFARWFVLIVPAAMGLVGLGIGDGRDAYRSATGQVVGTIAVALIAGCWWWSGAILTIPKAPSLPRRDREQP